MSRDPVCSCETDELQATTHGLTSDLNGRVYFFCSAECKERFDRDPAQFELTLSQEIEDSDYRSWPME